MACCLLECALKFPEGNDDDDEPLLDYDKAKDGKTFKCSISLSSLWLGIRKFFASLGRLCRRCCKYILIPLFILLLLTFLVLFVVLPVVFMHSKDIQKSLIFYPKTGMHSDYDVEFLTQRLDLSPSYKEKARNFYVDVNKLQNLSLGAWYIPYRTTGYSYYNGKAVNTWENITYPVVLYFHQEKGDRKAFLDMYDNARHVFNLIPFDYRSYGDSSVAELVEDGLVEDGVALYKWLRNKTDADIYIWGDMLGSSIATHVVARLQNESITPTGLILENPFPTLSDAITGWYWPLGKILSWLPWYKATITDPLEQNGLSFKTNKYIVNMDCPIMILQWKGSQLSSFTDKIIDLIKNRLAQVTVVTLPWYNYRYYGGDVEDALKRFVKNYSPNAIN